jgi:hypothetical protein
MTDLRLLILLIPALAACGGAPEPTFPDATPPVEEEEEISDEEVAAMEAESETIDVGFDCAKAEAVCEGGVCTVTVNNTCEGPITCELKILSLCRSETDAGEARGAGRGTAPPGKTTEIQAAAKCEGREVAGTQVDEMTCR